MMFWDSEVAKRLLAQGALRPLDVQFARFIGKQAALAGHNAAESELLSSTERGAQCRTWAWTHLFATV